jgi:hypothetical protein
LIETAPATGTVAPAPEAVMTTPGIAPPAPECAAPPEGHRVGKTIVQLSAGTTATSDTGRRTVPALDLQPTGELTQPMPKAVHVRITKTCHLFIRDKVTKLRFLIDIGSDLCVYPRKLIPQRRTGVNYDICAANGTIIATYGWLPLSFNLGLSRDFTWRFVVTYVT